MKTANLISYYLSVIMSILRLVCISLLLIVILLRLLLDQLRWKCKANGTFMNFLPSLRHLLSL